MKSSKGLFIASIILFLLSILNFNVCLTTKGIGGIDRTELHYYDGPAYSHQQQSRSIEDAGYNEERTMHPGDLIKKGSFQCPTPLVPFYDVIPEKSNTTTTTLSTSTIIPRTLFVSMKSRCLPQDYYEILQRWQQMLPNYAIRFYDDDDVDAFLFDQQQQTTFPHLKEALRCIQFKGAMIIDVWRMLILYQYGGVYTDIDNWPLDKFSEGLWTNINDESNNNTNLTAFFFSDSAFRPTQWFMAMEPRHPIAYFALLNIQNNLYNLKNLANPDIITVTGPNTLRDAFYQFIYSEGGYESMAQTGRFSKNLRGGEGYFTGMHQMRIRKLGTFSRGKIVLLKIDQMNKAKLASNEHSFTPSRRVHNLQKRMGGHSCCAP